jgi:hypothetical protein
MGDPRDVASRSSPRQSISWRAITIATTLSGATIALLWLVAVPWGPIICTAIYPAPTNCDPNYRAGTALILTAIILVIYLATAALAFTVRAQFSDLVRVGIVALAVLLLISYFIVAWYPGFLLAAT